MILKCGADVIPILPLKKRYDKQYEHPLTLFALATLIVTFSQSFGLVLQKGKQEKENNVFKLNILNCVTNVT